MTVHKGADWRPDSRPVREVQRHQSLGDGIPSAWPGTVPAVRQLLAEGLEVPPGVTFLIGENGSGKSTLVEGIAAAFGLDPEGGTTYSKHTTRESESQLNQWITLVRGASASRWGFFLRAETMHSYYTFLEAHRSPHKPLPELHEMSHGESFLSLLQHRFDAPGFYCLDEPEAALSFSAVLALIGVLNDLAAGGSQILCATHSPVLASLPGAKIIEVGDWGMRDSSWEDLELVYNWRAFLDQPQRYLQHIID